MSFYSGRHMILLLVLMTCFIAGSQPVWGKNTVVGISGENFTINGQLTYSNIPGSNQAMHGLLFNVRSVNSTFDDLNNALPAGFLDDPGNRPHNNYAGYGTWDADANTDRFIAALPSWKEKGVLAVTLNFQGGGMLSRDGEGGTRLAGAYQTPNNNPYGQDGAPINPAYLNRMKRVIDALDANGMVAILGLFYFGQDHRLKDDNAVMNAVDAVVDWVEANEWRNVLIEVTNEANMTNWYQRDILRWWSVHNLFERIKTRSASIRGDGTRLFVSASSAGMWVPPTAWMQQADFFLPHGNDLSPSQIIQLVADYRAHAEWQANPRPICFNEDSTSIDNLNAAASVRTSWGLYNDLQHQSVWPANWTIWSPENIAFFDRVAELVNIPDNVPPTVYQTVLSNTTLLADNTTLYTVQVIAEDMDGVDDIRTVRAMFHNGGSFASENARGYLCWGKTDDDIKHYEPTWTTGNATGGGRWGWNNASWGSDTYITPVSCSTSISGNRRTVTWNFKVKSAWATASNQKLRAFADDTAVTYTGWVESSWNYAIQEVTPPSIVHHPVSISSYEGDKAMFTVDATGTAPLSYQWRKEGSNIPGSTSATYQISSLSLQDAGNYDCVVSNAYGSVVSNTAVLTVIRQCESIAQAKHLPDGTTVQLDGPVVSAAWGNFFYISANQRSSGIRVEKASHGLTEGMVANIIGQMQTNSDGERYIEASGATQAGTGSVTPLGMANRSLGGEDFLDPSTGIGQVGVTGGSGPNNIGLLVRIWGHVTHAGSGFIYMDDGSTLHDGSEHTGTRVNTEGMSVPAQETYLMVTGIVSCLKIGNDVHPLIRATEIIDPGD